MKKFVSFQMGYEYNFYIALEELDEYQDIEAELRLELRSAYRDLIDMNGFLNSALPRQVVPVVTGQEVYHLH